MGSTYTEIVYGAFGQTLAHHNRSTWTDQFFYLGAAPFAKYQGNVTYFIHGNHLGSTTMVFNHTGGTVVQDMIFYPWGERWDYAGTVYDERFASLGRRDAESTLDPTLFRMYESRLYRWLSPDPLAGDISNPQSLNRYAYVLNNPTNLIDPLGLFTTPPPPPPPPSFPPFPVPPPCDPWWDFFCDPVPTPPFWPPLPPPSPNPHGGGGGGFPGTPVDDSGAPIEPGRPCSVTPQSIDDYLSGKDSPLTGEGDTIFHTGARFNVDPRLTVAIAGAESSFGKNTNATWGLYNAWGWTGGNWWTNWETGIFTVTRGLGGRYYIGRGEGARTTTSDIYYGAYCDPTDPNSDCASGLRNISTFLRQQGASTTQLTFPCE